MIDDAGQPLPASLTAEPHPSKRGISRRALVAWLVGIILAEVLASGITSSTVSQRFQTLFRVPMPYSPSAGLSALNDPLQANTDGYNWPESTNSDGGACQFIQGAYHVKMTQAGSFHYCIAGATEFSNFAYEVRMTILEGDGGGLIFRADGANGKFYYFRINRDGSYALYLYTNTGGVHGQTLVSGIAAAVHTGLNIPNVLAVVARGSTIDLYVNDQRIDNSVNSAYSSGQIGLVAAYVTGPTEVVFSNARVWTV